jgi:hypothetical protein
VEESGLKLNRGIIMKNFKSFIIESRKNPERNPKISSYDALVNRISSERKPVFISFTMLEKLGINPKSEYNTPLAVYAYEGTYVLDTVNPMTKDMKELPYVGESPYANIFTLKSNANIVNVGQYPIKKYPNLRPMNSRDFDRYLGMLRDRFNKELFQKRKDPLHIEMLQEKFNDVLEFASSYTQTEIPGRFLWYMTMKTTEILLSNNVWTGKDPIKWAYILRDWLKIDAAIDNGTGTIHQNEKSQVAIFNTSAIERVTRHENKTYIHGENILQDMVKNSIGDGITKSIFRKMDKKELLQQFEELYVASIKERKSIDDVMSMFIPYINYSPEDSAQLLKDMYNIVNRPDLLLIRPPFGMNLNKMFKIFINYVSQNKSEDFIFRFFQEISRNHFDLKGFIKNLPNEDKRMMNMSEENISERVFLILKKDFDMDISDFVVLYDDHPLYYTQNEEVIMSIIEQFRIDIIKNFRHVSHDLIMHLYEKDPKVLNHLKKNKHFRFNNSIFYEIMKVFHRNNSKDFVLKLSSIQFPLYAIPTEMISSAIANNFGVYKNIISDYKSLISNIHDSDWKKMSEAIYELPDEIFIRIIMTEAKTKFEIMKLASKKITDRLISLRNEIADDYVDIDYVIDQFDLYS